MMLKLPVALIVLGIAIGIAVPALAQDVPPLVAPDVTTLTAPAADGSSSGDTTLPASDASTTPHVAAPPAPCGNQPISIARMAWPSAALLAEIHARILKGQFNCTVQVLPSDLAPAISGMASAGQPAVAPEMWVSRVADTWNQAVTGQKLRQVGVSYQESQFEGWYVPDYVLTAHPELRSVSALKDDWQLFANGGPKGKFISCPADWGCAVINRNLLKAYGLDLLFDVVEPKNRFDLDQLIAGAISRKEPVLFYYWQPNAALSQFSFKPLDLGPYSKDDFVCLGKRSCATPKPSGFAPEPVVIALADWVFTGAPQVAAYFQRAQMPMTEMNTLLAGLNEPGATVEGIADKFVQTREPIWRPWVGTTTAVLGPVPASSPQAPKPAPAGQ